MRVWKFETIPNGDEAETGCRKMACGKTHKCAAGAYAGPENGLKHTIICRSIHAGAGKFFGQ
jgi:hypothetical protein